MKIIVGSHNQAKLHAVQQTFTDAIVLARDVESEVAAQPKSDDETMHGAINRARSSRNLENNSYGIGLEGGVMQLGEQVYLCNWGALVTPEEQLFVASGARIPLPDEVAQQLAKRELGDVMREWTQINDIRHHQGAIGIFTDTYISRQTMFAHVVELLAGQLSYFRKHS
ncbi:DUF84 family protein [Gracilibacillus sp. S3-1-1]|uniref:DUF84 family protein n=1 Tax=Gracilibacillus pellucidus TaxID=3095368 RepID=A0ACC6M9E5_9BACI|nr:DUF84 family protein [Gracilibacillus sp. S3-1-1]MDX8047477.1 DUF84 family protein [Gracilibacillus sp. S3-1-1]